MARENGGGFGRRFKVWLFEVIKEWVEGVFSHYDNYFDGVAERIEDWREIERQWDATGYTVGLVGHITQAFYMLSYIFFNRLPAPPGYVTNPPTVGEVLSAGLDKVSGVAEAFEEAQDHAVVRQLAETLGSFVIDPALVLLLPGPGETLEDVRATARRFAGMTVGMPLASSLLRSVASVVPGEAEFDLTDAIQAGYWALGLGFLGWQSLSEPLRISLQEPQRRYYNRLYRPERFNLSTLLDLYLMGAIRPNELYDRGAELGWPTEDMKLLVEEAQTLPSRSDLRKMRDKGLIDEEEHDQWLRKLGYLQPIRDMILAIDRPEVEEDALRTYRSTIKNAYEEGLIDETEFREHAEALNWSPIEIDLQLALLDLKREGQLKRIAKGDVERSYKQGVINKNDARNILLAHEFSHQAIDRLLRLWDAELAEPRRRITSGTVQQAIVAGVLSSEKAIGLLVDTGYPREDALVVVQTAEAQRERSPEEATVGAYIRAFRLNLITLDDFREGLRSKGLSERAIQLYTDLAKATPGESEERITESQALRLYRYGRWTHSETLTWLMEEGHSQERAVDLIWLEARKIEEADVVSAYNQAFISQDEAVDRLTNIGYTVPMALEVLGERERRLSKSDVLAGMIQGLYTMSQARQKLKELTYSEVDASFLITSELFAVGAEDVIRRYRRETILYAEAQERLNVLGYTDTEAKKLLEDAPLLPSETEILRAYKHGLLDTLGGREALVTMGLAQREAEATLQVAIRESGEDKVVALWKQGLISDNEAILRLGVLGYSQPQAREKLSRGGE